MPKPRTRKKKERERENERKMWRLIAAAVVLLLVFYFGVKRETMLNEPSVWVEDEVENTGAR